MINQMQSFVETLSRYPSQAKLLSRKDFVEKWSVGDPLYCGHDVAWWIHNGDYAPSAEILKTLDQAIGKVIDIPGMSTKLKALRDDPAWTWGHLIEVFFTSALVDAGAEFTLPESGADVELMMGSQALALEITSLRRARWFPRLHERLGMLGERLGVEFDYTYQATTHEFFDERTTWSDALRHVLESLTAQIGDDMHAGLASGTASVSEYGFSTHWQRVQESRWTAGDVSRHPNELAGATLVMEAVRRKARQIPRGRAVCVLVDATNDEAGHVAAIPGRIDTIDWSEHCYDIPEEVKHVIVCGFSMKSGRPGLIAHLERPDSPFPSPAGLEELIGELFKAQPPPSWWNDLPDLATEEYWA